MYQTGRVRHYGWIWNIPQNHMCGAWPHQGSMLGKVTGPHGPWPQQWINQLLDSYWNSITWWWQTLREARPSWSKYVGPGWCAVSPAPSSLAHSASWLPGSTQVILLRPFTKMFCLTMDPETVGPSEHGLKALKA